MVLLPRGSHGERCLVLPLSRQGTLNRHASLLHHILSSQEREKEQGDWAVPLLHIPGLISALLCQAP